ncbi:MAG: hypothetical protein JST68_16330 [Bacteroidetes bacterium]|nr:hypothetical protein [Bacteroidota bacterium]
MYIQSFHPVTLEKLIHCGFAPDLRRLSDGIFKALESVFVKKRWFEDVCEENVLCMPEGRFEVPAGAATVPCSALPETARYASKEYWMPVFSYLIGRVRLMELKPGELPGILFNYLEAVFMLLRVRLVFIDQEGHYGSAGLFDQLPIILDKMIPEYRVLFTRLLSRVDKTPGAADLEQIKALFLRKVVEEPGAYSFGLGYPSLSLAGSQV